MTDLFPDWMYFLENQVDLSSKTCSEGTLTFPSIILKRISKLDTQRTIENLKLQIIATVNVHFGVCQVSEECNPESSIHAVGTIL